ncbi:MAG: alpha/beta hydrolase [Oligoflexia bacterium]|nr:alpha/beta hydrolase [Oligoflexia bacterium]
MIKYLLLLCLLAVPSLSCTHLLYHPTQHQYYDPVKAGVTPDEIWFENDEGQKLFGWYFHAKTKTPSKALIVFFHGNAENLSSHFATLLFVLEQGYDFFIFDYSGYGKSPGKPTPKATIQDGKAAIKWASDHRKGKPLVVFGQSLGGAIAMRSVAEVKDQIPIDLVVVDSTFHSYKSVANRLMRKHWVTWLFSPLAYVLMNDTYSPEDSISKLSPIPMVVIHGDQDQTVDYQLGKEVFHLAQQPKEFWEVPGGMHTDAFWRHGKTYRDKFIKRLDSLNK